MKATKGGDFKPAPQPAAATTFARCYSIVDFGTAEQYLKGVPNGKQHRIMIQWEIPEFQYTFSEEKGPQPFSVSKEVKLSSHPKAMLAIIFAGMRGTPLSQVEQDEGIDPMILLGKKCMLAFGLKVKGSYANQQITQYTTENSRIELATVAPLPNGMPEFPPQNPILTFDFAPMMASGTFDHASFSKLPKWMREKIEKSDEFLHFKGLGQVSEGQEYDQQAQQAPPAQAPVQQAPVQQYAQPPAQAPPQPQAPPQAPPAGNPPAGPTSGGW